MIRDALLNRKILAGFVFFVTVAAGSLLYSWHVRRATEAELTSTGVFLQPLENRNQTRTIQKGSDPIDAEILGLSDTAVETDGTQTVLEETGPLGIEETEFIDDPTEIFSVETFEIENVPPSPYGVSPYGFGPYPEVPTGFPDHLQPIWTWAEEKKSGFAGSGKDFELMHRVLIKLWNQGDQDFVGVTRDDRNGKVYPIYPEVVYVTWREAIDPHGNVHRYPGRVSAGPNVPRYIDNHFTNGSGYPPHITVLDREVSGIEPYRFLGLQKR